MAIILFFRKRLPLLLHWTNCYFEYDLFHREIRILKKKNRQGSICSLKEKSNICHTRFMIPVNYTEKNGKRHLYHEVKPEIKQLVETP